ncbi:MAG: Stk1 family PASTA domain-containing Ser/Thr kinase [Eggerthellaceae bacterium]
MAGSMIGRTFNNRYKLTERVGLGGMAEVYRAEDNVLGRTVAVKVMLPQYAADPTFTKRFRQEAASAANLQSPYIVSIYDWGLDGETYYIVMEFLRGTDLKTAIKERGAINQRKAAEIGSQVAQALSVAHEGGIIHRDIKPQNIMIQPDGNIKVMDFGIARAGDAGLSQTATVLGTAHYVSPEQAQGKELTGASDIYSLGVVLYEAATGQLPFDGQDAVSVAVKQVNETPALPSTINPNIDPNLEAIIMKALEKDPERRFKDASEMRHILNDFLAGRPVNLGEDISGLKTQVMGGVAPMNGTAVMDPIKNTTDPNYAGVTRKFTTDDEPNEPKKNNSKVIIGVIVAVLAVIGIVAAAMAFGNNGETATVPDVTNKPIAEARAEIQSAGFKVGTETEVYNSDIPTGSVVSTNPAAGEQAKKGSTININVSKGTEQVTVPDLKGKTADEAQKALAAAGLNSQQGDTVFSDDVEEGKVASQDTASGATAYKGDTIVFHLSKGPEKISIPNVVGMTQSQAVSRLENAGFSVSVETKTSSSTEKGSVISQSQTGSATKGTTITITVSSGLGSAPNVVGMTESTAIQAIEDAGYKYDVREESSQDVAAGKVIRQSTNGSTITIYVSTGPSSSGGSDSE